MGGAWKRKSTDDQSELRRDSQLRQNRISLSLLSNDIPQANTQKKFSKNGFHTPQGTMFHRPLTNNSSLKITAAYFTCHSCVHHTIISFNVQIYLSYQSQKLITFRQIDTEFIDRHYRSSVVYLGKQKPPCWSQFFNR